MNTFAIAQLRYDMAAPADDSWEDAAIDELWDDCAAEYARENVGYILDREDMTDLMQRAIRLSRVKVTDETMRGLGQELLEIVRAYQAIREADINALCIARAEDMMRGGA